MHRDSTMRIHIPIITNPSNFFVFQDAAPIYIPAGWAYKIDTTNFHTFMNCSDKPRLHLVGAILDSKYKPPNIPAYSSIS
jgi:aspartyl/asparaginyl beta-hydroxylase (cupin superfamily)